MTPLAKGFVAVTGSEVLLLALSVPLVLRKVPRNVFFGYRTRATLADDSIWYEANAYFGRGLLIGGLISALFILFVYGLEIVSGPTLLYTMIAALVVPLAITALLTARRVSALAAQSKGSMTSS